MIKFRSIILSVVIAALVAACSGSGSSTTKEVASGLQLANDTFTFANFGAGATPEQLNEADLVTMFGGSTAVCQEGKTDPCVLTPEAAIWARMANQARQSGHCEGFAVLAASRFMEKTTPASSSLTNEGDVTHGIMRAFATQFLPEAQKNTLEWQVKKPSEIAKELKLVLGKGETPYTLGVYTDKGGHAILPYAVEDMGDNVARVKIYDSNWPGMDRYVDIDTKAETWEFSYSGKDPATDNDKWTGGAGDMDLTALSSRLNATCPFCGDGSVVAKTTLVVRSSSADWAIDTADGRLSPQESNTASGSTRPIKRADGSTAPVDYVVILDSQIDATFNFPSASKVTGITPLAGFEFSSQGSSTSQVVLTETSVSSNDPQTVLTLAAGDLVATANGAQASLSSNNETINVKVETSTGETINVNVTQEAPVLEVRTAGNPELPTGVAYEVLKQTGTNEISRETVSSTGVKSVVVETGSLDMSSVEAKIPETLQNNQVSADLPPAEDRTFELNQRTRNAAIEEPTTTVALPDPTTTTVAPTTTVKKTAPTTTPSTSSTTTTTTSTTTTTTAPTTTTTTTTSTTTEAPPTATEAPTTTTTIPAATPWTVLATGASNTQARDLTVDAAGNSYSLGAFCSGSVDIGGTTVAGYAAIGHCNISIAKMSATGEVVWGRSIQGTGGQNWGSAVAVDSSGAVYVSGDFNGSSVGSGGVTVSTVLTGSKRFLMKFNSAGTPQWGELIGGNETSNIHWVDVTSKDGVVYIAGTVTGSVTLGSTTLPAGTATDLFVSRIDPTDGSHLWSRRYGSTSETQLQISDTDPSGSIYLTGHFTASSLTFGNLNPISNAGTAGTADTYVVKINSSGTPLWSVRGGGSSGDTVGMGSATANGFTFSGDFASPTATFGSTTLTRVGGSSSFVSHVSETGIFTSSFVLASDGYTRGIGGIVEDGSGDYFISGIFNGTINFLGTTLTSAGEDTFVLRVSSTGTLRWVIKIGNAQTTYNSLIGLARDSGVVLYIDVNGSSPINIGTISTPINDLDSIVTYINGSGQLP